MSEFAPLVASPLLGGHDGRRTTAGRLDGEWALEVNGVVTTYGSPVALVHAFNAALRDAGRAGLASRPEPVELTVDALGAAEQAL